MGKIINISNYTKCPICGKDFHLKDGITVGDTFMCSTCAEMAVYYGRLMEQGFKLW